MSETCGNCGHDKEHHAGPHFCFSRETGRACPCTGFVRGGPTTIIPNDDQWGDDPNPTPSVNRFDDGFFHHEAVAIFEGNGFVDHWGGDVLVDGCVLPEFMQWRVRSGDHLHLRTHQPGRIVAFIRQDDGQIYTLPFRQLRPEK